MNCILNKKEDTFLTGAGDKSPGQKKIACVKVFRCEGGNLENKKKDKKTWCIIKLKY